MDTLEKIRNTMKSFEGRIKALENDPNVDFKSYCDRTSSLEHEFFKAIKGILDKDKEVSENISSVELAKRFGLLDGKD